MRVTLTTCIPSPYQVDLFRALQALDDMEVRVLYWRDTTSHLFKLDPGTGYGFRFPMRWRLPFAHEVICPGIVKEILKRNYDVFVLSGVGQTTFLAIPFLILMRKKWCFWGERPHPFNPRRGIKGRFKAWFWRMVGRRCAGFIGIGRVAVDAYAELGVPEDKLANVPYCPNLEYLLSPPQEACESRDALRASLGVTDSEVIFLYTGTLTVRKGVDLVIDACREGFEKNGGRLVILGEGPERERLAELAKPLGDRVRFVGSKQRPELYHYYLAADAFVLASRYDGWGVVMNEAMGAGLPCIVSNAVGAAQDMIVEGVNGFVIASEDVQVLAERIRTVAEMEPRTRESMGAAAMEVARRHSAPAGAVRLQEALEVCLA